MKIATRRGWLGRAKDPKYCSWLRSPPRHCVESFTLPVPHQWLARCCEVNSTTFLWTTAYFTGKCAPSRNTSYFRKIINKLEVWGIKFNAQKCYIFPTRSSILYSLGAIIFKQVQQNPRQQNPEVCILQLTWSGPPTSPTSVREKAQHLASDQHLASSHGIYRTALRSDIISHASLIRSLLEYCRAV